MDFVKYEELFNDAEAIANKWNFVGEKIRELKYIVQNIRCDNMGWIDQDQTAFEQVKSLIDKEYSEVNNELFNLYTEMYQLINKEP